MIGFFVTRKILLFSYWRILNFSHIGGLKLNFLFFHIRFISGAKAISYVWELTNVYV